MTVLKVPLHSWNVNMHADWSWWPVVPVPSLPALPAPWGEKERVVA